LRFPKEIDSKFRFVIIASKRAKQLLYGAKPKVKSKFRNLIRIAQGEIEQGVIGFDIVRSKEEAPDVKDEVLIGQELKNEEGETEEEAEKVGSEKDEEDSEEEEEEESDDDLGDETEEK